MLRRRLIALTPWERGGRASLADCALAGQGRRAFVAVRWFRCHACFGTLAGMANELDLRYDMGAQRRPRGRTQRAGGPPAAGVDLRPDMGAERRPRPADAAI